MRLLSVPREQGLPSPKLRLITLVSHCRKAARADA